MAVERGRWARCFLIKLGFAAYPSAAGPGCRSSSCGLLLDEVAVGLAQGGEEGDSGSLVPVVVSMFSSRLRKPIPRLPRSSTVSDQMAKASTQPVESPHHEGVPFAKQRECQLQLRELCLAPARHVDKELVDACFVQAPLSEGQGTPRPSRPGRIR